ncbi:hypothetical protein ALC62_05072 [Cyphomyrmex costatus]|uniref:Uncharacterized protein n=1 Tax=Cyphomyrmex costatus TaxID=456900 RepID=A0A195CUE6_9HYME|nr:hypothetical protein ALC62_05072 [Cyphomyrmex costatus]
MPTESQLHVSPEAAAHVSIGARTVYLRVGASNAIYGDGGGIA